MNPTSDTIRVSVVLENAGDEAVARLGSAGATSVRRVVTEAFVDLRDTRPTPLCVPEDLVTRLGLREQDARWDRRCAGPITTGIGGRRTFGVCLVGPPGSPVRIGSMTLRALDLVPHPVTRTLRPGTGIRV